MQPLHATWISRHVSGMRISAIKEMAMLSARTPGAVSLAWGLPSFRTPAYIREGTAAGLATDPEAGMYTLPDGLREFRELVARQHELETGIGVDPDDNVLITAGNMQGLNIMFHVIVDPGDDVIVTDPGFASHVQQIRLCGGTPVYWRLREEKSWELDLESLPGLISARTKAIVLVSPSNPTGKIFSREALLRVGEIARQRNLLILLDDPYRYFTYDNTSKYFNLASEPALMNHVVYFFTFSKTFAMSGWRLGYMILPAALKREALKVHDATIICTPRISQIAGIVALRGRASHLEKFERILAARRDLILERLDRVPHVFTYVKPEGAYYVFPRITAPHMDSVDFSRTLLREAKVSVTPGSAFGPAGEHHVRMAFCVSEDVINTAFDRIEASFGHQ
jgi:aminotransferase